jgi:hypothetical protein
MSMRMLPARLSVFRAPWFFGLLVLAALVLHPGVASAQQQMSKRFPAGNSIRLVIRNISGKVIVESWDRSEVKITATIESPAANVAPKQLRDGVMVDVMGDNRGRGDIGNVNFKIQVPANFIVDIETRMGDITIANIRSKQVRAHVTSEGDIELIGIVASEVFAQNLSGNIFFDGEVSRGGSYQFQSGKGDISIRIPASSVFDLNASALDKKLALGGFWNSGFRTVGEGQRFSKTTVDVNDGRAKLVIRNFEGGITFVRR